LSFTPKDLGYVKETDAWVALAYINTHNLLFRTEVNIEKSLTTRQTKIMRDTLEAPRIIFIDCQD